LSSEERPKFGQNKREKLPKYCRKCPVLFACRGECPKNRFIKTPDGKEGLNYLCGGYKVFIYARQSKNEDTGEAVARRTFCG